MGEYLNFAEISTIPFLDVLNWLNIGYQETETELKGDGFVINKEKNLYLNPQNKEDKGSVINFLAQQKGLDLRTAASQLKAHFLVKEPSKPKEAPILPDYELSYHDFLHDRGIKLETAQYMEMGYCKQGVMRGKVAVCVRDSAGLKVAYIGRNLTGEHKYFFYKGYKHDHVFNLYRCDNNQPLIITPSAFECALIHQAGHYNTAALLQASMSQAQEDLLAGFDNILLIHPKPDNIIVRLAKRTFVRAVQDKTKLSTA